MSRLQIFRTYVDKNHWSLKLAVVLCSLIQDCRRFIGKGPWPWWWRQQVILKRRQSSTTLHSTTTQKNLKSHNWSMLPATVIKQRCDWTTDINVRNTARNWGEFPIITYKSFLWSQFPHKGHNFFRDQQETFNNLFLLFIARGFLFCSFSRIKRNKGSELYEHQVGFAIKLARSWNYGPYKSTEIAEPYQISIKLIR